MTTIKFPNINVQLVGQDGNAFSILGRVTQAMRRGGCSPEQVKEYRDAATSGDYNNLLLTTMATVNCDSDDDEGGEE